MPYIGQDEIVSEAEAGKYVAVTVKHEIKDEDPKEFTLRLSPEVLEAVKTEVASDDNLIRDKRCEIVAQEVMKIFLKHNIGVHAKAGDLTTIFSMLTNMTTNSYMEAEERKWGIHPYDMDILSIQEEIVK